MKTKIYTWFLLLGCLMAACSKDKLEELDGGNGEGQKDVILIRMGDGDEVKDVTSRLYQNIPISWEIREKKVVEYDHIQGDKLAAFNKYVGNKEIYCTVVVDIEDLISGKYPVSVFRELKFFKRDLYVIATKQRPDLEKAMLGFIGVYMEPGYYGINYDNLQRYRIFPSADPYAKDEMIGKGVESFKKALQLKSNSDPTREMYNEQMADKEALKSIEIYNRLYGYASGDGISYSIGTSPYKKREGADADVIIDNSWVINAYNFQIYSRNNNCILSVSNTAGNGFSCNIRDYTTPKSVNRYAYVWNLLREASSEVTVSADGNVFREISYQPQTVNHGSSYTESSGWNVSVAVSPAKLESKPWEALKVSFSKTSTNSINYKTQTMDLSCKGLMGNGMYNKKWQFIPGQFYEKQPAFYYDPDTNQPLIDAVQTMTPNYITWGGYTLRQNYLEGINNSMKLHKQQCIYSLQSDADPGIVSVTIQDAMNLQKTEVHYNCGIRYGNQSATTGMSMTKMVMIDFGQWNN